MKKSRISQSKQAKLLEHFVAGLTARYAADLVGVNRKPTIYYSQRLREIIAYMIDHESEEVVFGEI